MKADAMPKLIVLHVVTNLIACLFVHHMAGCQSKIVFLCGTAVIASRSSVIPGTLCWFIGLEEAICALVDVYLASPRQFYVTDVLGHACIKITEAQDKRLPLIRKFAA